MPRPSRPRKRSGPPRENNRRGNKWAQEPAELNIERIMGGGPRVEEKGDGDWFVRPISAAAALKTYTCPGCGAQIPPGTSHLVIWRDDWIMGEQDALSGRRHWHTGCWRARSFKRR